MCIVWCLLCVLLCHIQHDRTLLHIAVLSQQFNIVQFLLEKNADVNAVDDVSIYGYVYDPDLCT